MSNPTTKEELKEMVSKIASELTYNMYNREEWFEIPHGRTALDALLELHESVDDIVNKHFEEGE